MAQPGVSSYTHLPGLLLAAVGDGGAAVGVCGAYDYIVAGIEGVYIVVDDASWKQVLMLSPLLVMLSPLDCF